MAPAWAKSATGDEPGQDEVRKAKRPDTVTFLAALDNFSLAAHACGVRTLHALASFASHCFNLACRFGIMVLPAPTLAS